MRALRSRPVGTLHPWLLLQVANICQKMAAKRSKLKGSSDDGGRRGQQQRRLRLRLRLRCDFVAVGGVGCIDEGPSLAIGAVEAVKDFCGSGLRLGRKV
ncbi:hypothetical protein BHM03_00023730 [Ensete ventricosum]|uniref:Uncharacterized protein n=1 Tax=Ensete ventricosum TaxID=4639 RepID=A0A445MGS7_ENSVE|nr:hypothetical protein BHM03_00023730 [Ensete ventricosum]